MSTRYAFLILPAANRVYADAAPALTRAELAVFAERVLSGKVTDIEETTFGGVPYVSFNADGLTDADLGYLANISSIYTLFEVTGDLLRPVTLTPWDHYDDDLLTIQKYSGKTNEHFTKLLLNVTALASRWSGELPHRRMRVFDPLCGRGTTMNQALMYGWDAIGIDHDAKDFDAYGGFLRTWCRRKRLKHDAETTPVRRERKTLGRDLTVTVAPTKQAYRAGDTQTVRMVNVDTLKGRSVFKAGSFDLAVTDVAYGVQHGSRSGLGSLARSPLDLLRGAVPVWAELLRSGGALGMAWNVQVADREAAAAVLVESGLELVESASYAGFSHRVDASILRDVLVACKP